MTLHPSIHRFRVVILYAETTPMFPHLDCAPTSDSIVPCGNLWLCPLNSKGLCVAPRDWGGQVSMTSALSQLIGSSRLLG